MFLLFLRENRQKIVKQPAILFQEPGKVRETMQMIFFSFMRSNISFYMYALS